MRESIFTCCPAIPVKNAPLEVMRIKAKAMSENISRIISISINCLLILLASSCAMQTPVPDIHKAAVWETRKLELEQLQSWMLKARIAIQLDKEGGSASMNWSQTGAEYLIRIIPPFGRGTFELDGDNDGVTMRTADEQLFNATDPETLLQTQLGWQVPVTGLIYWIRGIPEPSSKITKMVLDNEARLQHLSQNQWDVSYTDYIQSGDLILPRKMSMQNGNLKVKLLIKKWERTYEP
jgi:outer membrane lipoprotein LolB